MGKNGGIKTRFTANIITVDGARGGRGAEEAERADEELKETKCDRQRRDARA
jgi:hypothetical protein